jgi:translation elongation factor EF-Tu-like GTPase
MPAPEATSAHPGVGRVADEDAFTQVVVDSYEIKGRGVSVIGRFTGGVRPPAGTRVVVAVASRPPIRAVIAGRAVWHPIGQTEPPADQDWILLRGVSRDDVPVGAILTLAAPNER